MHITDITLILQTLNLKFDLDKTFKNELSNLQLIKDTIQLNDIYNILNITKPNNLPDLVPEKAAPLTKAKKRSNTANNKAPTIPNVIQGSNQSEKPIQEIPNLNGESYNGVVLKLIKTKYKTSEFDKLKNEPGYYDTSNISDIDYQKYLKHLNNLLPNTAVTQEDQFKRKFYRYRINKYRMRIESTMKKLKK